MRTNRKALLAERRAHPRIAPPGVMRIDHHIPGKNIPNAEILDISVGGAALRFEQPVVEGERLVFTTEENRPPVLCEVIECEFTDDGWYRARCRCIMGGFDTK